MLKYNNIDKEEIQFNIFLSSDIFLLAVLYSCAL